MKRLFLTSSLADIEYLTHNFLQVSEIKTIIFVKTAANYESYTAYINRTIEVFQILGYLLEIIDIANLSAEEIKNQLENNHCLYFAGGNTFYLLQKLKQKDLIEYLQQKINHGMIYIGKSACAIIVSRLIDNSEMAKALSHYEGLALIDFYLLPSDGEEPFIKAITAIKEAHQNVKLSPINNHQAVIVKDNQYCIENEI